MEGNVAYLSEAVLRHMPLVRFQISRLHPCVILGGLYLHVCENMVKLTALCLTPSQGQFSITTTTTIMFSRTAFSAVCESSYPMKNQVPALTVYTGRRTGSSPSTQSTPLATLRPAPEIIPINRNAAGNRQGGCFCARRAVYEGYARDSAVWLLKSQHPDSGPARRQPRKVHRVQCFGGRGIESR